MCPFMATFKQIDYQTTILKGSPLQQYHRSCGLAAILDLPSNLEKNTPLKRSPGEGLQSLIALFLVFIVL